MSGIADPVEAIVVDDDPASLDATRQLLELSGFVTHAFTDARLALDRLGAACNAILITDIRMPTMSGLELLAQTRLRDEALPVILITGHGDVATAVSALKGGAWDFLTKPFDPDLLVAAARRAAEARAVVMENRRLRAAIGARTAQALVGATPAIVALRERLPALAASDLDVVIEGASGTGKALLARTIHRSGARARHRLVPIDCAAAARPGTSGAEGLFDRAGPLARAHRGTLLLTGLDRASATLQDQLARFAETRCVAPDSRSPEAVDVRIIATLAEDRREAVLPELYHRLAGVRLHLPPLSERREDIEALLAALVHHVCDERGCPPPPLAGLAARLAGRDWPGNVRELRHFAERLCLGLEPPGEIREPATLNERLEAYERRLILEALAATDGDVTRAVARLGLPRKTFYYRAARLGIDPAASRPRRDR